MIRQLRAALRVVALCAWTAALVPVYCVAALLARRLAGRIPPVWYAGASAVAGLERDMRGLAAKQRGVLYVVNHVSYVDIIVLGAILRAGFVAKAEVRRWPVIGWLAALQDTVFVERRTARTAAQLDEISRRLARGDSLVLFPEGTSSDGTQVLPFRSALLDAAWRTPDVIVQPVSLAYTHVNDRPIDPAMRDKVAWYGDMELAGHLWALLGLGRIGVAVRFHPPMAAAGFASRKQMAVDAHRVVAEGLAAISAEAPRVADPWLVGAIDEPILVVWPPFD